MAPTIPKISLSRWVDYLAADNQAKVTKVGEILRQYERDYSPGGDYWRPFRAGIIDFHRSEADIAALDQLVDEAPQDRRDNYRHALAGYRRFLGRRRIELGETPRAAEWTLDDRLSVRLNPDATMHLRGEPIVVQFHLKAALPLDQRLANPVLFMLAEAYGSEQKVGILDVHRGRLLVPTRLRRRHEVVLRAQASAFAETWRALREPARA